MATDDKKNSNTLLQGTFILTIGGLVVKVIGSLNWIFISRVLGGEGIGLYQMAFPIYFFALSISTAGFPVAISILTAERVALRDIFGAKQVFKVSMLMMFITGLLFSLLTYLGAGLLVDYHFIRDARAYLSIVALSPAIFFVTLLASSRGYLQGWQRMTPTAMSQIVEQIFRVITMILLANLFLPYGLEYAAAGASLGACAGAVTGLIVLVYYHIKLEKDIQNNYLPEEIKTNGTHKKLKFQEILQRIFKLALPISATSIMLPIVSTLDLIIVPQRLEVAGYSVKEATELFGYLTGMAVPLINLATILTASLAVSIVPAISEARALNNKMEIYNRTATGIRISNIVCFPAFIIVLCLATPISTLIYNAPKAGEPVWVCSFSIVLLGLHQVSTGVLQGLGYPMIPMVNMALAAFAKIVLSWFLTAEPSLGIMGAAWATAADMGVAAVINLYFIHRYMGYSMEFKQLFKTMVCAAIMALLVKTFYDFTFFTFYSMLLSIVGSVIVGLFVYLGSMLFLGAIKEEDLDAIPFLGTLSKKLLHKCGIFKNE